jgi:hypothetical protein
MRSLNYLSEHILQDGWEDLTSHLSKTKKTDLRAKAFFFAGAAWLFHVVSESPEDETELDGMLLSIADEIRRAAAALRSKM